MGSDDFGWALSCLKHGRKMARKGWNGKNQYLFYVSEWICKEVISEEEEKDTAGLPFIAIFTVQEEVVPWLASQTDILAEDWEMVE